ncbi:MAG: hypothetical protein ACOCVV_00235 [Marinobacter sp.]
MDFFEDRRGNSPKGLKPREVFGRMLELLQKQGLPSAEARQELTGLMNGHPSGKIEALGIRLAAASPGLIGSSARSLSRRPVAEALPGRFGRCSG